MEVSKENKKSQKLFGEKNQEIGSKNIKEQQQDKISIKDGTADLLKINLMKQQNTKLSFQKNNYYI